MTTAREVGLSVIDAWNRRDIDAVEKTYAPDATIQLPANWPDATEIVGSEAIASYFRQFEETWIGGSDMEALEVYERGDRVAIVAIGRASGRSEGIGVDFEYTMIFTVAEGKIVRAQFEFGRELAERFASEE